MDDWLTGLVKNAGGHAAVVDLETAVHLRRQDGKVDPHWWQDPRNVLAAVARIRDELTKADPQYARSYRRRARAYLDRVRSLDRALAACLRRVPPAQRQLVTNHDAFGYFAARYGLRILGAVIPSLSTQAQPSAGATANLVRLIRRTGVKAIFAEHSVNPALERNIAREAGARVVSSLYGDALGAPGSTGATWLDATAFNGREISAGLSGGRVRCALPR